MTWLWWYAAGLIVLSLLIVAWDAVEQANRDDQDEP